MLNIAFTSSGQYYNKKLEHFAAKTIFVRLYNILVYLDYDRS